jgi:hypothetical protein
LSGTRPVGRPSSSEPTRPLPSQPFTKRGSGEAWRTPSAPGQRCARAGHRGSTRPATRPT